jgi:hypothetical protein
MLDMEPQPLNALTILPKTDVSDRTIALMVAAMIFLALALVLALLLVLPNGTKIVKAMAPEARWIVLVAVSGALGAYVHMAHSFVTYVGLEKVKKSWLWWYAMRPFIGMALALAFFLVYGASTNSIGSISTGTASPGGILAIAVVVGMFSKQAIDKLAEVFDMLLKSDTGDKMKDKDSLKKEKVGSTVTDENKNNEDNDPDNNTNIPTDPNAVG